MSGLPATFISKLEIILCVFLQKMISLTHLSRLSGLGLIIVIPCALSKHGYDGISYFFDRLVLIHADLLDFAVGLSSCKMFRLHQELLCLIYQLACVQLVLEPQYPLREGRFFQEIP